MNFFLDILNSLTMPSRVVIAFAILGVVLFLIRVFIKITRKNLYLKKEKIVSGMRVVSDWLIGIDIANHLKIYINNLSAEVQEIDEKIDDKNVLDLFVCLRLIELRLETISATQQMLSHIKIWINQNEDAADVPGRYKKLIEDPEDGGINKHDYMLGLTNYYYKVLELYRLVISLTIREDEVVES
jgi:hypothetical protein